MRVLLFKLRFKTNIIIYTYLCELERKLINQENTFLHQYSLFPIIKTKRTYKRTIMEESTSFHL